MKLFVAEMLCTLTRLSSSDQGTFGVLVAPGFWCYTLELPWRDNQSNISCIPKGKYAVEICHSPHFGTIYHIKDVPDRANVLIHAGNWAGDVSKGYRTNVKGCILLGARRGVDNKGQKVLWNSGTTVRKFMSKMHNRPFELVIGGV